MKPMLRVACVAGTLWGALLAQAPGAPEPLSAWPYYQEIQLAPMSSGLAGVVLGREVLEKARDDQADLRLYSGAGREMPYILRVRREIDSHSLFTSREFNRAVVGSASLVSCDLGEQPQEHNEVHVETAGNNFRRLADVEGSPDGASWVTLASQAILFHFTAGGRSVEQQSVSYPTSRYRYVRVRVERDPQVDRAAPEITSLGVRRSIRVKGETIPFSVALESREADPIEGRPASIWRIDLMGRVPVQSLQLNVTEPTFSRPFQLEIMDDPSAPAMLASGEITRREGGTSTPIQLDFGERFGRRLKLTVTDDRNPPLSLIGVTALSAARQVIFESSAGAAGPVRLYYGNPKAIAPRYDVAARIPAEGIGTWTRVMTGAERANPTYHPEPKPLSERSPWLVYVVLLGACAALAAILVDLARASAKPAAASQQP